jgi:hypothetical protein
MVVNALDTSRSQLPVMPIRSGFGRFFAVLTALTLGTSVWAGGFKVRTQLIWGTDEAQPPNKDYQQLSPQLKAKLLNNLRWKNYFIVNSHADAVAKETCRFTLSERCTVGLKPAAKGHIEVQIFNPMAEKPTEPVFTKEVSIEALRKGETVAIGANSKDRWDDAWLVLVTAGE